jgi:hypothetical protein
VFLSDANPAAIAQATSGRLEVLGPVHKGFHEDSRLWQIGALWPAHRGPRPIPAVAFVYREYDLASEISFRTAFEPEAEPVVIQTDTRIASILLGMPILNSISLGGALRHADVEGMTGWYGDVGATLEGELHSTERVRLSGSFAVAARQLGDDIETVVVSESQGPQVFARVRSVATAVGSHLAWGGTLGAQVDDLAVTAAVEVVDPLEAGTTGDLYEHAGLEVSYRRRVALRAGVVNDDTFDQEFTYGAGVRWPVASRVALGLDYAREPALPLAVSLIEDHAPKASHFFALTVEFDPR